jgi:hypothetical protein
LQSQAKALSAPALFMTIAGTWAAGRPERLWVRTDSGINLDELAVKMIDGSYRDAKRGCRPADRMSAEAH